MAAFPGETWTMIIDLTAATPGAYLDHDNLNEPVNRVVGLHRALIVTPTEADRTLERNMTPYCGLPAMHGVQRLYDGLGRNTQTGKASAHYLGLAWEEGDNSVWALYDTDIDGPEPVRNCSPFRRYLWLTRKASPKLFGEMGDYPPGEDYPAHQFLYAFLRDPFQPHAFHTYKTHSMHLHANDFYVTRVNGWSTPNPLWVDVFRIDPMDLVDTVRRTWLTIACATYPKYGGRRVSTTTSTVTPAATPDPTSSSRSTTSTQTTGTSPA